MSSVSTATSNRSETNLNPAEEVKQKESSTSTTVVSGTPSDLLQTKEENISSSSFSSSPLEQKDDPHAFWLAWNKAYSSCSEKDQSRRNRCSCFEGLGSVM